MALDSEMNSSLISLLLAIPAVGSLLVSFLPQHRGGLARLLAVLIGLADFCVALLLLVLFRVGERGFQFAEHRAWLPSIGVYYSVGLDGLSLSLIVLTTFLVTLVMIAAPSIKDRLPVYLGCVLFLESGMLGVFCALDVILFYVFWEAMLIPMYVLIGVWGGDRRVYAALKFVLFTAVGSLLMLAAIVYLGFRYEQQFSQPSFALSDWMQIRLSLREEFLLFAAFALSFAIKIPIVPLHTWLPDAHVEAPTGGSVILAGILLKMGLYGLIRFCIPMFPVASAVTGPLFAALGVIGIVYGALVAWVQDDFKKLVAYSSISHLGFCVLGYGVMNIWGLEGAMLQMLNHGLSTGALFFVVGVIYDRWHTRRIDEFGGLARQMPVCAFVFMVFVLSSIGLPLTNGFVGEFLVLFGGFRANPYIGAVAASGMVLGAVYMLSVYRRMMFGELVNGGRNDIPDLNLREKIVFAPLLAMVLVLGVYPQPVLDLLRQPAQEAIALVTIGGRIIGEPDWEMDQQRGTNDPFTKDYEK